MVRRSIGIVKRAVRVGHGAVPIGIGITSKTAIGSRSSAGIRIIRSIGSYILPIRNIRNRGAGNIRTVGNIGIRNRRTIRNYGCRNCGAPRHGGTARIIRNARGIRIGYARVGDIGSSTVSLRTIGIIGNIVCRSVILLIVIIVW